MKYRTFWLRKNKADVFFEEMVQTDGKKAGYLQYHRYFFFQMVLNERMVTKRCTFCDAENRNYFVDDYEMCFRHLLLFYRSS